MAEEDISDREAIKNLKNGQSYFLDQMNESVAEIWKMHEIYILFKIPLYGGPPRYQRSYSKFEIDEMIDDVNSWT